MKLIIFGTGKHAELTCFYFQNDSPHEVVGFCLEDDEFDQHAPVRGGLLQLPVFQFSEVLARADRSQIGMHVAIGDNEYRSKIFHLCQQNGFQLLNYMSNLAIPKNMGHIEVGANIFIDPASRLHPFVSIGDNTILISALICHHCHIGKHVLISGATLAGDVTVGDHSFIGLRAVVREHVTIGRNNIIGATCYIGRDTNDNAVYSNPHTKAEDFTGDIG